MIEAKTAEIEALASEELDRVLERGGSVEALQYMKEQLVGAHAERRRAIESGEQVVVGVNRYVTSEPSPLVEGMAQSGAMAFESIDPAVEAEQIAALERWRAERDTAAAGDALDELRRAATSGTNLMEPSINAACAGVTTGEWADALRDVR